MVEPFSIVTESVISAFLRAALKRISEKLSQGRMLTEVETLTLLMNEGFRSVDEHFNSIEREMRSGFKAVENRMQALETQYKTVHDVAEFTAGASHEFVRVPKWVQFYILAKLRAKVNDAQLEART